LNYCVITADFWDIVTNCNVTSTEIFHTRMHV